MSGPRRLRDLVGEWKPGAATTRSNEAASLIAAWPEIVGADLAQRTRPLTWREGALTVLTVSSAWSHQLSFLAPAILERLRERSPQLGIKRIRFAVATGRTRALLEGSSISAASDLRRMRSSHGTEAGSRDAASIGPQRDRGASIETMLADLKVAQATLDERRMSAGWRRCAACGSLYEPRPGRDRCALCIDAEVARSDARIAHALAHEPWMRWEDVAQQLPGAQRSAFERVSRRLLASWEQHLRSAQRRLRRQALEAGDRVIAWSYVMMRAHKPQLDIGRAVVKNALDALDPQWAQALLEAREMHPKK